MNGPPPSLRKPEPQPAAEPQRPVAPPAALVGAAAWPPWMALAAFAGGLGATIVLGAVVFAVVEAAGGSAADPSPGVGILLTVLQNVALVAAALFFANLTGRARAEDFGLRATALGRAIGLTIAVFIGFYALSALWVTALSLDERQTLPDELGAGNGTLNLLAVVFLVTVIAPIGEELFFRGYFFGALRNWRGGLVAAIISGAVFGAIHLGSSPAAFTVPLALFGFGLAMLYHWTGSLYPPIVLHALNNAIALGVSLKWSWEIPVAMVVAPLLSLWLASLLARAMGTRMPSAPAPSAA